MHITKKNVPGNDFLAREFQRRTDKPFFSPYSGEWNGILVKSGSGWIQIDGGKYSFSKGDFLLRRRDHGCILHFTPQSHYLYFGMVPDSKLYAIGTYWDSPLDGLLVFHFSGKELQKAYQALHESAELDAKRPLGYFSLAYSLVENVILRAEFLSRQQADCQVELQEPGIAKAIRLLGQAENTDSIESIARECGYSRAVFFRKIREATGCSPHAYREKIRLRRARELLLKSSKTIFDIAELCHFNEATYFSRRFKQQFGMTPVEFRNQSRKDSSERTRKQENRGSQF